MKRTLLDAVAGAGMVALLLLAGCLNPLGSETEAGSGEQGAIVLAFSDGRAKTILPPISLEITRYQVSFTRTGFQPVNLGNLPGNTAQTDPVSLRPGLWTVTATAFNQAADIIGVASAEVLVKARQTSTISLTIRSLSGNGTLSLSADLSEVELVSPTISGSLTFGTSGEVTPISLVISGSSAGYTGSIAAGTYLLALELVDGVSSVARYVDTVLIVKDLTSFGSLVFRAVQGSVVVQLADEITRPIAVSLSGLEASLTTEESMTVTASPAVVVDSYQWYLDGQELSGQTSSQITLGPGLGVGQYALTVVVKKGALYSSQSALFTVVTSSAALYVAIDGTDVDGGGTLSSAPLKTISFALLQAVQHNFTEIRIQAGIYDEIVRLLGGVTLRGGYDAAWQEDGYELLDHATYIRGGLDSQENQYMSLVAINLTAPTLVKGVIIQGIDAIGAVGGFSRSSYAVYASNALSLSFENLRIIAAKGADGSNGSGGESASPTAAESGEPGGSAAEYSVNCDSWSRGVGGSGGGNDLRAGGAGGGGGTMDTNCNALLFSATAGQAGRNAALWQSNSWGMGGGGGAASGDGQSGPGLPGKDGHTVDGLGGTGAPQGGTVSASYWLPASSTAGSLGLDGTGGGGGGGSGGSDFGTDSYGAGGGGGGAGGLRAPAAGEPGTSSGTSFGLFVLQSTITIKTVEIVLGTGGNGGKGGDGGIGQPGGLGGSGGSGTGDSSNGGNGGNGGAGGSSGGGGGGAGGDAYGVYTSGCTLDYHSLSFAGGQGGSPGPGGITPGPAQDGGAGASGIVEGFLNL